MIEAEGLTKVYGAKAAVKDLSFTVHPGQVMGLVGPNGAGKTTTLRCLAGIIMPTGGRVTLGGVALQADPLAAKQRMAFFSDEPRLFDYLTVRQHLAFTARLYQVAAWEARAVALLDEMELTGKEDALPAELSRGMKQKVVIACGLLHQPQVLFFDEPLTGLDPLGIRRMKATIQRLGHEGASIMISSHLLTLLEEVCTDVLILKDGQKVTQGFMADIRARFGADGSKDGSLEEAFIRLTADAPSPPSFPVSSRPLEPNS
jgi:ABC-2 type transport system ATP-binding protein